MGSTKDIDISVTFRLRNFQISMKEAVKVNDALRQTECEDDEFDAGEANEH